MEAFSAYVRHGWKLCPILTDHKGPQHRAWNTADKAFDDPEVVDLFEKMGLLHALSGTCAIDIDDYATANLLLEAHGVDLDALYNAVNAVRIIGNPNNHGKLLYALPEPLRSRKISVGKQSVIDFRCISANGTSLQDVLPPSMHPSGKPYRWDYAEPLVGDWRLLPPLPPELRRVWESLIEPDRSTVQVPREFEPVDMAAIQLVLDAEDPDSDRDSWVETLAALHWETRGSDAGLALADAWSAKGKKYKGFADVETRWKSFSLDRKNPSTFFHRLPAAIDDFEPVVDEDGGLIAPTAADKAADKRRADRSANAQAKLKLDEALVYVSALDRYWDTERHEIRPTLSSIDHLYSSRMPRVNGNRLVPSVVLKNSGRKRVVKAPAFHPGEGEIFSDSNGAQYINTYLPDKKELLVPTTEELDKINWLFNRIDDPMFREWLRQWFGHALQYPGRKIMSAPLIWSEETGNGKSTMLEVIPWRLFGAQYCHSMSASVLASDYNGSMGDKWYIYLSEMHADARGTRHVLEAKMKGWITDSYLEIHPKGKDPYNIPNVILVGGTSNKGDAGAIDNNDRRWGIHELNAPKFTAADCKAIYDEFLSTPRASGVLRHYFKSLPINDFRPESPAPKTASRMAMIALNESEWITVVRDAMDEGIGPFSKPYFHLDDIIDLLRDKSVRYVPGRVQIAAKLRSQAFGFHYHDLDIRRHSQRIKAKLWSRNARPDNLKDGEIYDIWKNPFEDDLTS